MKKEERNIYLSNLEVEEALSKYLNRLDSVLSVKTETIDVIDSVGRVTVKPIFARVSSPNYNAAAMDGIAVIAKQTFGANESNPVILTKEKDFVYVNTGNVIFEPYDSVIMIEDVVEIDNNTVRIISPASPWQHIRPIGEDIVINEMIVSSNHKIRPIDIGALLSGGINKIEVYKKMGVGIIPTGTEIIEPWEELELGKIYESNSRMFSELIKEYGGCPNRYSPIDDEYDLLKDSIYKAVNENDMVIVNAGSSAGSKDYTRKIIDELGETIIHGIATKPGKPTILGIINDKPIIGIPGYPVSAYLAFEIFVKPLIYKLQRIQIEEERTVKAIASKRIVSSIKYREYVRIKLGAVGEKLIATPLNRGAGVTMSLVRADGVLEIPQNSEGVEGGEEVEVKLLKGLNEINNTIVSIGSHDLIMDIIGNIMHKNDLNIHLSSAHVGSLGGIMAMSRGEAHISPIHLLDEDTGEYNIKYIKRYLKQRKMALIKGVKRIQGLIVKKGNPKNINSVEDLTRDDVVFVNRQRGSGTRILVDYLIKKKSIKVEEIIGYNREMTTHMVVAAAVDSNSADVGVGVLSAAKAMDLDFIPIGEEEYDFAVPMEYMNTNLMDSFINTIKSEEFKKELVRLGGYKFDHIGEVIFINE